MSSDETLREKLKQMPHIAPPTDRETMRRHVLAEVEERERRPRRPRKVLLPTAFAAALAVFMFVVMSPWLSQQASNEGAPISLMNSNSGDSGTEMSPAPEESSVPAVDIEEDEAADSAESELGDHDSEVQPSEEQSPADGVRSPQTNGEMRTPAVKYTGSMTRTLEIEGFSEKVVFDNYVFEPYGLQILIPAMSDGEKWFAEPLIDGEAAVFESRVDLTENGQIMLSSITVSVHDGQTTEEVIADEIATEEENAKEIGYKVNMVEETLANGERLIFSRVLQDNNGREYTYYREMFVTEQNGLTFAFHIGRNAETSDGFSPRLVEVVYPELKIVK